MLLQMLRIAQLFSNVSLIVTLVAILLCGSHARLFENRLSWNFNIELDALPPAPDLQGNDSFDFFVYAQEWTPAVCIDANITHEHKCAIPNNVTSWTVHGLWPTRHGSHEPSFCNDTLKFNATALLPIRDQLMKYWPNVYTDTPINDFWEHEWTKHGTCANSQPELDSELKYFSYALKLNQEPYNLLKLLQQEGVTPRDDYTYQYPELLAAVRKAIGGDPIISCTFDKATKTQYMMQIEICLDKTYKVIDCEDSVVKGHGVGQAGPCQDTVMVGYPTIRQSNVHAPTVSGN